MKIEPPMIATLHKVTLVCLILAAFLIVALIATAIAR
jgi:hypothetical protein